jgi:hypothetical protein
VVVPPKSSITIELHLAGRLARQPGRFTVDVGRQPAVHRDDVTVTFDVADGWRIHTTGGGLTGQGQTATARFELDRNVQLRAEITPKEDYGKSRIDL